MSPYTVIVQRPDFCPDEGFYFAHVCARSVEEAHEAAMREAACTDDPFGEVVADSECSLYYAVVACFHGHLVEAACSEGAATA